jgi:hypothetical protein
VLDVFGKGAVILVGEGETPKSDSVRQHWDQQNVGFEELITLFTGSARGHDKTDMSSKRAF